MLARRSQPVRPLAAVLALLVSAPAAARAEDAPSALEPVFNGKDLTGWRVPSPNPWWSVADGVLVGTEDEALKGDILESERLYRDAIVEADVRWSGDVDSGIFLRKGQQWQCQIGVSRSLKKDMTCSIYKAKGGYAGSEADPEKVAKLLKLGDWNAIRIEARGPQFIIRLNGEQVLDYASDQFPEPGPIGLQLHPGVKGMKIEFRNIKAQALNEGPEGKGGQASRAEDAEAAASLRRRIHASKVAVARIEMKNLGLAVESFCANQGKLPTGLNDLVTRPSWVKEWPKAGYIKAIPKDPWGNAYAFRVPGPGGLKFDLTSLGADGAPGGEGEGKDIPLHEDAPEPGEGGKPGRK